MSSFQQLGATFVGYLSAVLALRDTTERPEALDAGTVKLVGTDYDKIVDGVSELLSNPAAYEKMSKEVNPYGDGNAYDVLIQGLKRLEYRGYDSAGIALEGFDGQLRVYKAKGKVSDLEKEVEGKDITGTLGIAHTRWATHGVPNNINAHPHLSQSGSIAIVHNGTIENYGVLKEALIREGYTFKSETDTEVLVQLIEYVKVKNKCGLFDAVREALHQIEGAYAIAVIERDDPDTIVVARKSSPLVIGVGENETMLASDATPIVGLMDKVVYLKDDEMAVIRRDKPLQDTFPGF